MFYKKEDKVELGVQKPPVDLAQANQVVRVELAGHKLAEEALRATEEQLRFVADHMPVFIACCDDDRRYKLVNQPYAEMFGLRPADIIGKHARDVLGEEAYARASPRVLHLVDDPRDAEMIHHQLDPGRRFGGVLADDTARLGAGVGR